MSVLGVIPARYASSRFPGKALAPLAGRPMVQHVWERASRAEEIDHLVGADLGIRRYDKMIEGLGGYGEFVESAAALRPALERAQESGLPALVNVHIAEQMRMSSAYGG